MPSRSYVGYFLIYKKQFFFNSTMLTIADDDLMKPEVKEKLQELLDHVNQHAFMINLRSQVRNNQAELFLRPDKRGGLVAATQKPIQKGTLLFITDGPVVAGNIGLLWNQRLHGGIDADVEVSVKKGYSRKVESAHDLFSYYTTSRTAFGKKRSKYYNLVYYVDNACDHRGNLAVVTSSIYYKGSSISILGWYAKRNIRKGEKLSFTYYDTKESKKHCVRLQRTDGFVKCDCHKKCPNYIITMS